MDARLTSRLLHRRDTDNPIFTIVMTVCITVAPFASVHLLLESVLRPPEAAVAGLHLLEHLHTHQTDTADDVTITALQTFRNVDSAYCREFSYQSTKPHLKLRLRGYACRRHDSWQLVWHYPMPEQVHPDDEALVEEMTDHGHPPAVPRFRAR